LQGGVNLKIASGFQRPRAQELVELLACCFVQLDRNRWLAYPGMLEAA
jgi:hypothetical protein